MAMDSHDLEGFDGLHDALLELGKKVGGSALKAAAKQAMLPAKQSLKAAAPVGTVEHKSYLGRMLQPGYTKKSITIANPAKLRSRSTAIVDVGVTKEAFYGVQFFDDVAEKYRKGDPWFRPAYKRAMGAVEDRLAERLKRQIDRAVERQASR